MNVHLDNILLFRNFDLCLSYPKKILGSTIENEFLAGRERFRYRKLVVLMGANATGKTALGKALMMILNFISKKEPSILFGLIDNHHHEASFSIDLAFPNHYLYRISAKVKAKKNMNDDYLINDLSVDVKKSYIRTNDSYETCSKRFHGESNLPSGHYIEELELVPALSWLFEYPFASEGKQRAINPADPHLYLSVLREVLKVLDPRIIDVIQLESVNDTYSIKYPNHNILIKDGLIIEPEKLSSGTNDGIGVAQLISSIRLHACDFFYCDEKFSHIHSDVEKAFLSLMIDLLSDDQQLFFTTHNPDILDMNLPNHSFAFLRRDEADDCKVSCVFASDFIKKETSSLRNAVENDLFSSAPDTNRVYALAESGR